MAAGVGGASAEAPRVCACSSARRALSHSRTRSFSSASASSRLLVRGAFVWGQVSRPLRSQAAALTHDLQVKLLDADRVPAAVNRLAHQYAGSLQQCSSIAACLANQSSMAARWKVWPVSTSVTCSQQ
jgi:hypothetical protein